jgi:hypothetical protein
MPESITDFAARIKAKYPDYANVPDDELVQRIVSKYPDYSSQVDMTPQSADNRSTLEKAFQPITSAAQGVGEFGTGLLKGAAKTVAGIPWVGKQIVPDVVANPKLAEPQGTAESIGSGVAQAAPYFIPVGGEIGALGKFGNIVLRSGLEAAKNYGIASAQGGDAKTAAALGAAGPLANEAIGAAVGPLKQGAINAYSRVIGPTTRENKILTGKVVPELIDRGTMAFTRKGLQEQAASMAERAATDLESAYASLPQDAIVRFKPVLDKLEQAKQNLKVVGTEQVVDEPLYKALNKVQNKILDIAKEAPVGQEVAGTTDVSVATARSARQRFDAPIAGKTNLFGLTGKESAKLYAQKEGANAIRAELANEFPDIAKINKEFSTWKTVNNLLDQTLTRTSSQSTPLTQQLVTHAGATIGGAAGGGLPGAVIGGVAGRTLGKLFTSSAWRTVDAVTRDRLANLLARGKVSEAGVLAANLLASQTGQP